MAVSISRLVSQIKRLQYKADKLTLARDAAVTTAHTLMAELERMVTQLKSEKSTPKVKAPQRKPARAALSRLKGRKVAPKYRGPKGITWSGRGMTPVWLRDALKKGKKKDDFLIKRQRRGK